VYFLDFHTDEFKKEVYFNHGDNSINHFVEVDIICSGNELGMHAIGIDISLFIL
jgi:hypothetical protein